MTGWQRLLCAIGRHKLSVIARVTWETEHIGCRACGRQWGMNHGVRAILPWKDVAHFHRSLGYDEESNVAAWQSGRRVRPIGLS